MSGYFSNDSSGQLSALNRMAGISIDENRLKLAGRLSSDMVNMI